MSHVVSRRRGGLAERAGRASGPADRLLRMFYRAASGNRPSRALGRFADLRLPRGVLDSMIRSYCLAFRVRLDDAVVPPGGFETFDAFFTRRLRPGARPVDPDPAVVTAPSDGRVQSLGTVRSGMVLQAKGSEYSLSELLGDPSLCARLEGGPFATVYLSPRDYHRVHHPCDGAVAGCRYSPGRLYTVAPRAARVVERLFAQNERITTVLDTPFGRAALVMVGAAGVGRISVTCDSRRSNVGQQAGDSVFDPPVPVGKGDELGVFHLGSTVVLVLEPGPWVCDVEVGDVVRMGQPLFRRAGP